MLLVGRIMTLGAWILNSVALVRTMVLPVRPATIAYTVRKPYVASRWTFSTLVIPVFPVSCIYLYCDVGPLLYIIIDDSNKGLQLVAQ